MRVGLIGCGDIGTMQHLPALAREDRVAVVAVADADRRLAERAAQDFAVPTVLDDAGTLIASGVDAVVLATPPQVTCRLAVQALEAGLHVLCEKPIATTITDADAVVEAVDRTGNVLQVGFKNRFSPLVQPLAAWVRDGRLGWPLVVRVASFDERYDPSDTVHTNRIRGFMEHGPPVVHEGSHSVDLVHWMVGLPATVTATSAQSDPSFPAPNYHAAAIEVPDRALLKLEVGWWWPAILPGEFHLYGPGGAADLSRPGGYVEFRDANHVDRVDSAEDWQTACFRGQLEGFLSAIDGAPQVGATAAEAREVLRTTLAVVAAAERGHSIALER